MYCNHRKFDQGVTACSVFTKNSQVVNLTTHPAWGGLSYLWQPGCKNPNMTQLIVNMPKYVTANYHNGYMIRNAIDMFWGFGLQLDSSSTQTRPTGSTQWASEQPIRENQQRRKGSSSFCLAEPAAPQQHRSSTAGATSKTPNLEEASAVRYWVHSAALR